ncbi:MAG TPA: Mg2+/Co2+ transporter [Firmicutes bacterium]|nr:Mg2+/Co2+ transporter [Bacillota bacterium]
MGKLMEGSFLKKHSNIKLMALDFIKYIGPGLLVTVGFIDPGNWATNIAAGSSFGYVMLWVVTLGTLMLIVLQHNAAHLGIVTGYCLAEATTFFLKPWQSRSVLGSAVVAANATALAEILGGAIALNMLVGLPIKAGAALVVLLVGWMLFSNSYRKLERWIIGLVSLIGLSFIFELTLVHLHWQEALKGWVTPNFPNGSMIIVMSVLGAIVMPHNLFLHSEIIQSKQYNLADESIIKKHLKYEFWDTSFSMLVGWAINSAMILVAAATFFKYQIPVTELAQAGQMLKPLLGSFASIIFAFALLFAGISALVTAGMAGGSIFAGIFGEPYNIDDIHTKTGVLVTFIPALLSIFFITNPLQGLIYSQMLLSIQLPVTIFLQIYLTSSPKVMGKFANSRLDRTILWLVAILVVVLNLMLLWSSIS